jgi:hypothetical protein
MRFVLFSCLLLLPFIIIGEPAPTRKEAKPPKLLVLVVFDQLRGDYLSKWSPLFRKDGFNKLTSEGAWFTNCHYPYSMTVTGAGHATLGTGCLPSQHGIIENDWYDRTVPGYVYCATLGDRYTMIPEGAKSKSGKGAGGAPDRLLVPTVGDNVKAFTRNQGKVIGLSLKDRGGVLPTGMKADMCYWYDDNAGAFVTSTRYADKLPAYMEQFNAQKYADQWFGKDWTYFRTDVNYQQYAGKDDQLGEGIGIKQGRTFPHPMTGGESKIGQKFYDAVYTSPFGNDLTWAAAKVVIEGEKLGQRDTTDYFAVSYSSNDSVGHNWGPDSHEVLDITLRSDAIVAEMIQYLDEKVGRENYVIALSSDHGVCPNPEMSRLEGKPADRVVIAKEIVELEFFMKGKFATAGQWIIAATGAGVYFDHRTVKESGKSEAEVEAAVAEWFLTRHYAQEIVTRSQLLNSSPLSAQGEMVRRCFHPQRSGNVMPIFKPYHFLSKYTTGTTHGSPHPYDTHVPLVFFGGSINPGQRSEKVSPQLAAVTLAATVGQKLKDSDVILPEGLLK